MCIIVDACIAHKLKKEDRAGSAVLRWILRGNGKLVASGKLIEELAKTHLRATLVELERAKRLCRPDEEACAVVEGQLNASGALRSNDSHILALSLVSGCTLVFTDDGKLKKDLKNKNINPGGCAIYQHYTHVHLLSSCNC